MSKVVNVVTKENLSEDFNHVQGEQLKVNIDEETIIRDVDGKLSAKGIVPVTQEFEPNPGSTASISAAPDLTYPFLVYRNGNLISSSNYSVSGTTITFSEPFGSSSGALYSETLKVMYYTKTNQ